MRQPNFLTEGWGASIDFNVVIMYVRVFGVENATFVEKFDNLISFHTKIYILWNIVFQSSRNVTFFLQ